MRAHNYPFDSGHLLKLGASKARSEWERTFIAGLQERFEQYGYCMFLSEKQAAVLCRVAGVAWDGTCGDYFEHDEAEAEFRKEREQQEKAKKEQERARKERAKQEQKRKQEQRQYDWGSGFGSRREEPKSSTLAPDFIKRLLHLCHPDKHGGSKMATEVTAQLLKMR